MNTNWVLTCDRHQVLETDEQMPSLGNSTWETIPRVITQTVQSS